jgi:hypothetical protein
VTSSRTEDTFGAFGQKIVWLSNIGCQLTVSTTTGLGRGTQPDGTCRQPVHRLMRNR